MCPQCRNSRKHLRKGLIMWTTCADYDPHVLFTVKHKPFEPCGVELADAEGQAVGVVPQNFGDLAETGVFQHPRLVSTIVLLTQEIAHQVCCVRENSKLLKEVSDSTSTQSSTI